VAPQRTRTNLRGADADVLQIVALQSGDARRIRRVLDPRNLISASILPHVIPLLGSRVVAGAAMAALQAVADAHSGALIDALLDPSRSTAVRRRLARVLSVSQSQSAADGLLIALEDPVPDVRSQSARSLFRIRRRNAGVRIDAERVLDLVRTELTRDTPDLRQVFTLLACVTPVQALRAAYRGLRSDDAHARGTAREYLYGILPKDIRGLLLGKLD
jgi:HEAT repeat protein